MTAARARGVLALAGMTFVALACAVALAGVLPADETVRRALLGLASPALLPLLRAVNELGHWPVLLPATFVLIAAVPDLRRHWWVWLALMVLATTTPDLFKALIGRPRPADVSLGFPSGHATAAAGFFGAIVYVAGGLPPGRRALVRLASVALVLAVGVARVMLDKHWPSDALGGIALGFALAAGASWLSARRAAGPAPAAPAASPTSRRG
ncbi:MAG: phosphatase PAP2 family protein [Candidatus Rokubacteria bacterium]|nr:phosphatase PAP2 family protein [Candidatus Rokubacteria bacterium]MBI3826020.1 phosphatase PAP2 family protein [Candidatus Rokubacteria bacterium]